MTGVTGALLVGGESRRFGSPKALARVGQRSLAQIGWDALAWCDERLAVGKASDALALPFPIVDDASSVRAPLAGVVAALREARHDVCVVLPVDCPRMTPAALRALAGACLDAAVTQEGPLPGAFRRRARPVLEQRLRGADLSLRGAVAELEAAVVELDPALLLNVNGPADLPELR